MDIDKYTPNDLKKLFTKGTHINFLNDYTFQDVEDGKKKLYLQMVETKDGKGKENLKLFLDQAGKKLMEDKFSNGFDKPIGAVIKNTIKDNLNPDYKNTIKRLINIDSQFIPLNIKHPESYVFRLSEKLINVVSIELVNLQIPMTFYNIEDRQGNNFFYIYKNDDVNDPYMVTIPDGFYNINTLLVAVRGAVNKKYPAINFVNITNSGKITIETNDAIKYTIEFYEESMKETIKIDHCLGWILGFHDYSLDVSDNPVLVYTLNDKRDSEGALISSITSDKVAYIGTTKNIIVVLDEFSQNQTSGTMVQTVHELNAIKPTHYYVNSKMPKNNNFSPLNLNCLTPSNIITPTQMHDTMEKTGLTRAQIYTRAQINENKLSLNQQNNYLEPNAKNNVLAIVPVELTSFGNKYFTDKNKYVREYHGPVEIDKMQIRLYDEKGYEMNFNDANWSVTLMTEHLYKY
jgi:hypothetical protein